MSYWPRKGFSYGVSLTQFEHHIRCLAVYIRADLGITFSASAGLFSMNMRLCFLFVGKYNALKSLFSTCV